MEEFDWDLFESKDPGPSIEPAAKPTNNVEQAPQFRLIPEPTIFLGEESLSVSPLELRLLGFYNKPNQKMYPEAERVEEAQILAEQLEASFKYALPKFDEEAPLVRAYDTAVLVFRDREKNLYAFFPKERIARLTNVVYNKYNVIKSEGEFRCWFHPGEDFWTAAFRFKHRHDRRNRGHWEQDESD